MIRIFIISIFLVSLSSYNYSERNYLSNNDDFILWHSSIKLKWEDFQGVSDPSSEYKAITSTNIKTEVISYTDEKLVYNISCFFEKNKSWTKSKTNSLLKHEQLHFDIAELATRKMRKKFAEHTSLDPDSINLITNRIFKEAVIDRRTINKEYDSETDHGVIISKQKEWELKIAKELKKLEAYSSPNVTIVRK